MPRKYDFETPTIEQGNFYRCLNHHNQPGHGEGEIESRRLTDLFLETGRMTILGHMVLKIDPKESHIGLNDDLDNAYNYLEKNLSGCFLWQEGEFGSDVVIANGEKDHEGGFGIMISFEKEADFIKASEFDVLSQFKPFSCPLTGVTSPFFVPEGFREKMFRRVRGLIARLC